MTQGKVAFPGQLRLLGMKPKKTTIDFCSLLPKCGILSVNIAGILKRPPSWLALFSVHCVHLQLIERLIKESTNQN